MKRSIKSRVIALVTSSVLTVSASAGLLLPAAPAFAQSAHEAAARTLVLDALASSRMPQIYADAQHSLRTVILPAMRDIVSGKIRMPVAQNPLVLGIYGELITFLENVIKASDELDVALAKYREEMTTDLARVLARHLTPEEIEGVRGLLQQPISRKGFEATYTLSRVVTSYTYEEVSANQEFSGWLQDIALQFGEGKIKPDNKTPTPERMAKATAIVNEFMTSARIDEMVTEGIRFGREFVLVVAPEAEKAQIRAQLDTFEQQYTIQKPMMLVVAPAALAAALNDEQIDQLQKHMRGPGIARLFKVLYDFERSVTAFTVADFDTTKSYVEGLQAKGQFKERSPEEKKAFDTDMEELTKKWSEKLMASISPATREALEKSIRNLQALSGKTPELSLPNKPL